MIKVSLAELRHHPRRVIAVIIAIAISVGFVAATFVFVGTQNRAMAFGQTESSSRADLVVVPEDPYAVEGLDKLGQMPGVKTYEPQYSTYFDIERGSTRTWLQAYSVPSDPDLLWLQPREGRVPERPGEVAIDQDLASALEIGVGDTLQLDKPVPVVGILSPSQAMGGGQVGLLHPDDFTSDPEMPLVPDAWLVMAEPGTDLAALQSDLQAQAPAGTTVHTAREYADAALAELTTDAAAPTMMLMSFAAIAALVGAIIIANTFTILITQRRRQLGLLRTIGAHRGQVRAGFTIEAVVIGAAGSALGVLLGIGVGAAVSWLAGSLGFGLALDPLQLAGSWVFGVVLTLAASVLPILKATRVHPLESLRPDTAAVTRRASVGRGIVAGVLGLAGVGVIGLAFVNTDSALLLAIAGSALLALGVLLAAPLYVTALTGLLGKLLPGTTGKLAVSNTRRNPGRSATTATALMLAVGLVVTLQVASASLSATTAAELERRYPVDLMVIPTEPPADSVRTEASAVEGVRQIVPTAYGQTSEGMIAPRTAELDQVTRQQFPVPAADEILMSPDASYEAGELVTITNPETGESRELRVVHAYGAGIPLVAPQTYAALVPDTGLQLWWVALDSTEAARDVTVTLQDLLPTADVNGAALLVDAMNEVIGILVMVITVLLGVAVLIALVGVGNTLGLSVLERTQESGLLRALGVQRGQLRQMLSYEALLLAGAAVLVGVGAGFGFGALANWAASTQFNYGEPVFAVYGIQLTAVVVVALLAAVVASIAPGQKAAKVPPVAALADA
ncbi:FtsX-like permease family protein [Parenemella sanctibonifatiensis]|uniref:FtsX-like permease family protein n=1 Tax=Parenemella sanctibonifatiensis TaxID=2016505 RepID=A0A255EH67_9ACTN|nr:FtsX-like permease family protein [Parenemella sanctibonifatiensis]OYN90311.1 hypothetical protein CGZ91_09135 [Parenemella sanctibonifatiensis]